MFLSPKTINDKGKKSPVGQYQIVFIYTHVIEGAIIRDHFTEKWCWNVLKLYKLNTSTPHSLWKTDENQMKKKLYTQEIQTNKQNYK